jgi:acetyltransferase-like isoleucine patch superfamily enzyme
MDYRSETSSMNAPVAQPPSTSATDRILYNPRDEELAEHREKCRIACGKFNQAAFVGSSRQELDRLFHLISEGDGKIRTYSGVFLKPIGENISVEAPFFCTNGFNLRIGDNVSIGPHCNFADAKPIHIGDNTRIGPNVVISPEAPSRDMNYRHLSQAPVIKIGSNVYIGAGVIIAPEIGVDGRQKTEFTIGDGAYIAPGTIVTSVSVASLKLNVHARLTENAGCS